MKQSPTRLAGIAAAVLTMGTLVIAGAPPAQAGTGSVSVTSPTNGGVLTGTSAVLSASATPDAGDSVDCVAFYLDGSQEIAYTCTPSSGSAGSAGTYTTNWDTSNTQGVHKITAVVQEASGASITSAPVTAVVNPGEFHGLTPSRILDTRNGTGTGAPGAVGPRQTLQLLVDGNGGVPSSGAAAVVLNVTVTQPSTLGYLAAYPDGGVRPGSSNLNFNRGQTVANLVTVGDSDGIVDLYNGSAGSTQMIADVVGYYSDGSSDSTDATGRLVGLTPDRLLDTRTGTGGVTGPIAAHRAISFQVAGAGGVPTGAGGVVLNVTETGATQPGYFTAWPSDSVQPDTSSLNFTAGQTVPNLVELPLGASGRVSIYNGAAGSAQAIADVVGYYTGSSASRTLTGLYTPLTPARIADTRYGLGASGPLAGHTSITIQVTGAGGVPSTGVSSVVVNVTVTDAQGAGYLTIYPSGQTRPTASALNFIAGQTVPNLVVSALSSQGQLSIFNGSASPVQVIVDVQGFFS